MSLCLIGIGLLPLLESLAHQVPDSGVLPKLNTYKEVIIDVLRYCCSLLNIILQSLQPLYEACSSGVMKIKELGNGYTESLQNATTTTKDYDVCSRPLVLNYSGSLTLMKGS